MSIRSILVSLDGAPDNLQLLRTALDVARGFSAHLDALHVRADSRDIAPMFGEGMSGQMMEEMIASAERAVDADAKAVEALFREAVGVDDFAHWLTLDGREDEIVAWRGRLADLIVTQRSGGEGTPMRELTLNAALFETGRPVLVLPPAYHGGALGRTIAIAWNGTAQAARAVHGAMAFITRATQVHVLTCESTRTKVTAADELADYLKRWGVTAQVHAFPPLEGEVGTAILAEAVKSGADMVVCGAYSHARLMQAVLGGVTTHMMDGAPLPVLFSH
ncbi:MAG: universal stress protein [Rhodospirillales bacterium]|nr:universal stress protein [Rhodospirillales bacterium]